MSPKQQRFVDEYLIDLNATQAAIRAGYSERSAEVTAHRLLSNAKIAAAVAAAQTDRSERTKIDADWVLTRLAEEADADVADLYDDHGQLKPVKDWPLIWRKGLVAGIDTLREKIGEDEDGAPEYATVQKVKLSDRIKRIELIGKHVGVQAFKDNLDVNLKGDLAEMVAKARARAAT